jgi:small-conductance mechanosensitive channel
VRSVDDPAVRFTVTKVVTYGLGFAVFAILARIWSQGATGLATYLGLVSAGIAIALQDPLTNLAGWVYILARRPFRIGSRIQIGPHAGDVIDIRIFRFVMLEIGNWVHADQSTGRLLHVPNGWVFKQAVANYDEAFGYIWNELEVTVTFESNWRPAKEALLRVLNEHAARRAPDVQKRLEAAAESFHLRFTKLTPVVWTAVVDHGVRLTLRYLCEPRERRSSSSELWESILDVIDAMPDVDLAYPTTRFYDAAAKRS